MPLPAFTGPDSLPPLYHPAERCSGRWCNEPATGWIVTPDSFILPGSHCRDCATRMVDEYRQVLGQTWTFHVARSSRTGQPIPSR